MQVDIEVPALFEFIPSYIVNFIFKIYNIKFKVAAKLNCFEWGQCFWDTQLQTIMCTCYYYILNMLMCSSIMENYCLNSEKVTLHFFFFNSLLWPLEVSVFQSRNQNLVNPSNIILIHLSSQTIEKENLYNNDCLFCVWMNALTSMEIGI